MKRKCILILLLALVLALTGCTCEHEWEEATCTLPRHCIKCMQIEGNALGHLWSKTGCTEPRVCKDCGEKKAEPAGHKWQDADCVHPKTCADCALTEGEALGHSWADATCTQKKTCTVCAVTEGEALGHSWAAATTESPKTCTVCAATEGEPIKTDQRFTTASTLMLYGCWAGQTEQTCVELGMESWEEMEIHWLSDRIACDHRITFRPDGTALIDIRPADMEAYKSRKCAYDTEMVYTEYEAQGLTGWNADQNYLVSFGMKLYDYMRYQLDHTDLDALFDDRAQERVYYVSDGVLYLGESWEGSFQAFAFEVKDGKLTLTAEQTQTFIKEEA